MKSLSHGTESDCKQQQLQYSTDTAYQDTLDFPFILRLQQFVAAFLGGWTVQDAGEKAEELRGPSAG